MVHACVIPIRTIIMLIIIPARIIRKVPNKSYCRYNLYIAKGDKDLEMVQKDTNR